MASQYDVNVNMTLEVDADTLAALIEACDGDKEEAIHMLSEDLESEEIQSSYGRAWVCAVDNMTFIQEV